MASKLGVQIQAARKKMGMGLRELARAIGKSPSFVTRLEGEEEFPGASSDTLKAIASILGMEADALLVAAGRAHDVAPKTTLEMALYRRVQSLPKKDQQALLEKLGERQGESE